MSDLTGFLLARVAEDQAAAEQASWADAPAYGAFEVVSDCDCGEDHASSSYLAVDPARVLAECEAKRRIIAAHSQPRPYVIAGVMEQPEPWQATQCRSCGYSEKWQSEQYGGTFPCPTLRFLAAPYSDHVDFDPVWVVSGE